MRKRTVRKVWSLINPIQHAIEGAAITPQAELSKLLLRELASLESIVHGHGGLQEWHDINTANNLCQCLAEMGIGPEALETAKLVEQELIEMARRLRNTGRMGMSGPGIQAVRDMLEYHHLQRSSIARSKYEEAIRLVTAQTKSGHVKDVEEML